MTHSQVAHRFRKVFLIWIITCSLYSQAAGRENGRRSADSGYTDFCYHRGQLLQYQVNIIHLIQRARMDSYCWCGFLMESAWSLIMYQSCLLTGTQMPLMCGVPLTVFSMTEHLLKNSVTGLAIVLWNFTTENKNSEDLSLLVTSPGMSAWINRAKWILWWLTDGIWVNIVSFAYTSSKGWILSAIKKSLLFSLSLFSKWGF